MPEELSLDLAVLQPVIHAALRAWRKLDNPIQDPLQNLLLVKEERKRYAENSPTALRLAINQILLKAIQELEKQHESGAHILMLRFPDDLKTLAVSHKLGLSEDQVKRQQQEAITQLTEIVRQKELALRQSRAQTVAAALEPPSYSQLFGVDAARTQLVDLLLTEGTRWVAAIWGMGGIGKTSLADTVVRDISHRFRFDQIIWLRVNNSSSAAETQPLSTKEILFNALAQRLWPQMPPETTVEKRDLAIRQLLKSAPYLVVIDNLEAEADTAYLLAHLHDLANPSKFLLTTRTQPTTITGTFAFPLPELSEAHACELIRFHARTIGLGDLAEASNEQLHECYAVVGGNPLALKLVVGLAATFPLTSILKDLVQAKSQEVEALYLHIYWQAWRSLRQESKELLEKMPLAGGIGMTIEQMLAVSGQNEQQLWPAINELTHRSLLEVRGTTWERRYGIHQLTKAFLLTEIIHWPDGAL